MGVRGLGEEKTDPWKGGVREGLRKESMCISTVTKFIQR